MLGTVYVFAILGLLESRPLGIVCDFPGEHAAQQAIKITLEPSPSLKDQPGLFRVMMNVDDKLTVIAAAQPLIATSDRDILVTARAVGDAIFTIGLRDDGIAALNMRLGGTGDAATRVGACRGAGPHLDRWLPL